MLQFVPFSPKWAQEYAEMLKSASEQDIDMTGSHVMTVEEVLDCFQDNNRWDRLLVLDGRLVGDVNVFLPHEDDDCRKPEVNVFIAKNARNNGYAQSAIIHAAEYCRQEGYKSLFAIIDDQNTASISLFQKCGFTLLQRVPAFEQSVYRLTLNKYK